MVNFSRRHKVLLLIDTLDRGGAAQVLLNVALTLDRVRFRPVVVTTRKSIVSHHDDLLESVGVPLVELNRVSRAQVFSWIPLWKELPNTAILHSHESGSNFWARLWGKIFRVPIIVTQDHTAANEKPLLTHIVDRFMSSLSDRIIVVSEFDRALSVKTEKLKDEKVISLYNGIDINRFNKEVEQNKARQLTGLPQEKILIAIIARLAEQKNHQVLFEALKLIIPRIKSEIRCLVIGSGNLENQLVSRVNDLNLQNYVKFMGERADVPMILKAVDLIVLPSHWECLPMILLEALAAKCPIVSTNVGGVPEILNGSSWSAVKSIEATAIADAIYDVLVMPIDKKIKMTKEGYRTVVTKFSRELSVKNLERLYLSLISENERLRS